MYCFSEDNEKQASNKKASSQHNEIVRLSYENCAIVIKCQQLMMIKSAQKSLNVYDEKYPHQAIQQMVWYKGKIEQQKQFSTYLYYLIFHQTLFPSHYIYLFFCSNININYMLEGNSFTNSDSAKMSMQTTFQLKRFGVTSSCISVEVDFSPSVEPQPHDQQTLQTVSRSIPIYNLDSNYFTPSFILEMDKNKYEQNQLIYQTLFEKKIQQIDQQKLEMYLPRPSKTNSFCCVCKTIFEDYLTHVTLPMHRTLMQKSDFHLQINEICKKFSHLRSESIKEKKPRGRPPKTKAIQKEPKVKVPKIRKVSSITRIPSYSEMAQQIVQNS